MEFSSGIHKVHSQDFFEPGADKIKFNKRKNTYLIVNYTGHTVGRLSIDSQGEIRIKLDNDYCLSVLDLNIINAQVQKEILSLIHSCKDLISDIDLALKLEGLTESKEELKIDT